jgi:hypothetical protein
MFVDRIQLAHDRIKTKESSKWVGVVMGFMEEMRLVETYNYL